MNKNEKTFTECDYRLMLIKKKIDNWTRYSKNKTGVRNFTIYGTQRCYERIS